MEVIFWNKKTQAGERACKTIALSIIVLLIMLQGCSAENGSKRISWIAENLKSYEKEIPKKTQKTM